MTFTWALKFEDERYGENPKMVIVGADSEADAAWRCMVAVKVIDRAVNPNAG